ncbi:MAG: recombination protein RecR [Thiotrichales bacterium]|nr:MAG: recombination protein RecR [Thiotrichales bacterium]PCI12340.1 MAG: recombination protein RecR [Thiotrichales bacterium]
MADNSLIGQLVDALRCLPSVGPKSAQRMTFHLLERDRQGARLLAQALLAAADHVGNCQVCRTLSEDDVCRICANQRRERSQLCVVEMPADVQAVEQSAAYSGLYFVLMGHLSPIDGIGPEDIGLDHLARRFDEGGIKEVILAANPTVEGEATSHYIAEMARSRGIKSTRIAYGVPFGGELEYVDGGTLTHAFTGRREV